MDYLLNEECPTAGLVVGTVQYWRQAPDGSRSLITVQHECVPAPGAGDAGEAVDGLDSTVVSALVRRQLPVPTVGINPDHGGVTGMDIWLWADHPGGGLAARDHDGDPATPARPGVAVVATAGQVTVTAVAAVTGYVFTVDDDGTTYRSEEAGSEDDPAAIHRYTTKGDYEVTVTTIWAGTYTVAGPDGTDLGGGTLAPITLSTTRDYPVHEITAEPADTSR